jgi:hypothetical protein
MRPGHPPRRLGSNEGLSLAAKFSNPLNIGNCDQSLQASPRKPSSSGGEEPPMPLRDDLDAAVDD